ncbi:transglycosylase SLT domain-containing protein [Bacillus smithii]|uniref:transglycosylase SLT domain-containing protein n=1 Tax=Bacillus smithii TaxID=1479 RepID=UPI002E205224|nr:transglycosylase SLT domain-containing protein [Bacillus smithii]
MSALRDMTVNIGFTVDPSPLMELNREMNKATEFARGLGSEITKMQKPFNSFYNSAISESKAFVNEFSRQSDVIRRLSRDMGISATHLAEAWSDMSTDMRKSLIQNHNQMRQFRKDLLESEFEMRKLGMQMGHYTGTTDEFMAEIRKLGKEHKKITDQMINSNLSLRQGMIQSIATMSAMSGQSDKITKIYDRMGSSILKINNPLLAVTNHMEKMVRAGNAAQLALKMLGPNAKMKDLQDTISVINQGIMRQQAVLAIAGAAWLGFTAIVAHASLGPDPDKVKQQEANLTKIYRDAWNQRVNEISNFVGLFEKVSVPKVNGSELIKALQSQLNAIRTWRTNLQGLVKKGVDDGLIKELQKAGPAAAGQVKALNNMSRPELNKYVSLWREKMGLARTQATDELTKLREETRKKIQDLQNSLTPLGKSWERFKSTFASAFQPFVSLWGNIASHVVDAVTSVGNFINSINKLNPNVTKLVGMFAYLFVGLTMILSPLAVGIGLFGGFQAALAGTWALIGPFVTGFAAVAGTAALVSAAIVGVGYALYYAWNHSETFRNGVINAWNTIKAKAQEVWGFISPYINQAISAITGFVQSKLNALKTFWSQNGAQILQAVRNIWTPIKAVIVTVANVIWSVMKFVWPFVLSLIISVWGNIKGVINGALNVIMGLVKIFAGLFTGDFHKMWEGIKQVFFGAVQFIWNYVQLLFFGRVLAAGRAFFVGLKGVFVSLWNGARAIFIGGISAIKNFVFGGFSAMRNTSLAIFRGIESGALKIWNGLRGGLSGLVSRIVSGVKSGWNSAKSHTVSIFKGIKDFVSSTFKNIVDGAKALPGKIGNAIRGMAGKAMSGVKHLANALVGGLAQGVNGVTGGINWVLGKIGVDKKYFIPKWNPPKYAKGTGFHPGGPAIVGDGGGPELIRTPSGQIGLSPATSTLVYLPRGTEVLPHKETRMLLNSGMFPAYGSGKGDGMLHQASEWIKGTASKVWNGAKNLGSKALSGVKSVAGKAKDFALDIWSYLDKPGELMKKVWDHFGVNLPDISGAFGRVAKGAFSLLKDKAIGFVKSKLEGFLSLGSGGKGSVTQWIRAAMAITGVPSSWLGPLVTLAMHESGGNPRAINLWDSNYRAGHPSKGLMQTIDSTFNAYKLPGLGDIWNPVANAVAAIRYMLDRYGSIMNVPGIRNLARGKGYVGYATGGIANKPQFATLAENGWKEYIIPTQPSMRKNALALLAQANAELGYNPSTGGSTSNTYTPSAGGYSGGKTVTVNYQPHVEINVEGSVDSSTKQSLKQEVEKILDDHYKKLQTLFDLGILI